MTLDKLRKYCKDNRGKPKISVVVGYSQRYALEVHERTDVQHRVGQAKYLEEAARSNEANVREMLRQGYKEGKLPEAMLKAGLLIQRESQLLVPVDTSALKSSAFTTTEEELDQVSNTMRAKAEAIRLSVLAKRAKK